ncbi:MAG: hypothetical protein OXF02_00785 [Simkaniaceae bacterium]|nr:hypothetical protein [Simkaniaceae bacterium]
MSVYARFDGASAARLPRETESARCPSDEGGAGVALKTAGVVRDVFDKTDSDRAEARASMRLRRRGNVALAVLTTNCLVWPPVTAVTSATGWVYGGVTGVLAGVCVPAALAIGVGFGSFLYVLYEVGRFDKSTLTEEGAEASHSPKPGRIPPRLPSVHGRSDVISVQRKDVEEGLPESGPTPVRPWVLWSVPGGLDVVLFGQKGREEGANPECDAVVLGRFSLSGTRDTRDPASAGYSVLLRSVPEGSGSASAERTGVKEEWKPECDVGILNESPSPGSGPVPAVSRSSCLRSLTGRSASDPEPTRACEQPAVGLSERGGKAVSGSSSSESAPARTPGWCRLSGWWRSVGDDRPESDTDEPEV